MQKNIMGIDLNVDHDFLESAVRDTVLTAIASAMDKEAVVEAIVHDALSMRVAENGKHDSSWERNNKYTLLEYYVKKSIRDEAVEVAKEMLAEKMPAIRACVRREFEKPEVVDSLVGAFMKSVETTISSCWRCKVDVSFARDDDED